MKSILILTFIVIIYFSCKKDKSCETCGSNNYAPLAIAGLDQVINLPTDSVNLNGSASNDPDGTINNWLWTKISGPASFQIVNSAVPVTKVKNLTTGVYQFELKVTDDKGLSAMDTMQILVNDPSLTNRPPVANAGPDQAIALPSNSVILNGSNSIDPDNNIVIYYWTKISGPSSFSILNPNSAQTSASNLVEGDYLFELKVEDTYGLYSKDTVMVKILGPGNSVISFINQLIFNTCYDPRPGVCCINGDAPSYGLTIMDLTNSIPDTPNAILGVWIKMDTSNVWERVYSNCWAFPDPYPQTNFTYCVSPDRLSVYFWFYSPQNLAGRRAEVRIWL